ncbi:integrase core domain-containing protein [Rubinisphaera margarita]|uniref:integrase core domain-containing protein n=1 Tax=Rubinisphaera margarita TaxID=2909586 RepID=UPI001EE88B14|nr:integrase core domain-containing protein [Rubinisphaera margarita]MCG6154174.1 integrase core domain-containing protein [Rubinisphaera margarita]
MAFALKQAETGTPIEKVCRKIGVSQQTFYRWKKKFVGLGVEELRRLRQLEEENMRLKSLVADLSLDKQILQGILAKKALKPARVRECVEGARACYRISERRACRLVSLARSSHHYRSTKDAQAALRMRGQEVVAALERLAMNRALPKSIRVDNGPEFTSKVLDQWAYVNGVTLDFSRPGKPKDNAFIEPFNGSIRAECLNENWFLSLEDAQEKIVSWRVDYNEHRPHSVRGNLVPKDFASSGQASLAR